MDIDLSDVKSIDTVPLTSRDRQFFAELDHFMNIESANVGEHPSKERFDIFRVAFEKVIDKSHLYRPLLRAIKQEYEVCMNALESGAEEVHSMSADLHRLVLQPKTFLLRQKRCMELEDKLAIIEEENRQLEQQIAQLTKSTTSDDDAQSIELIADSIIAPTEVQTGHRRIPGLTFEEETNLKSLEQYYEFIKKKSTQIDENISTKYTTKDRRVEMQNLFERKLAELDKEREIRLTLRNRLRLYHLAWRTIRKYIEDEKSSTTTKNESQLLENVILNAIFGSINLFPKSEQDDEDELEGGSLYDKEAGMLLDHIEIFMDMIQRGNYKEASYVAACSPKGVLRNMETLLKFKVLQKPADEDISPWLFHCKVLADTALEAPFKPDLVMSLECAKAACSENHLNLLYKWIAEERLTCSFEMAQLVERAHALDLAEFIYRKVHAHYEVAACLLQINSSKRCLDYLESVSESIVSMKDLLLKLFTAYPSVKFAVDLMTKSSMKYFQIDEIVLLFLEFDQHFNAILFIDQLIEQNQSNSNKNECDKLRICSDILKKYSYLADEKESIESTDENEGPSPNESEEDFAHRFTRRLTRSVVDRYRQANRENTNHLETIEEHPNLCHQDFFNDFSSKLYNGDNSLDLPNKN